VPTGAVAEVYSCEIKEWVRVNDEGLVRPAPNAPFKRHVSIDKETGNAVGDALSACKSLGSCSKGFARKRVRDPWLRWVAAPFMKLLSTNSK
jgi:hypothetical protein